MGSNNLDSSSQRDSQALVQVPVDAGTPLAYQGNIARWPSTWRSTTKAAFEVVTIGPVACQLRQLMPRASRGRRVYSVAWAWRCAMSLRAPGIPCHVPLRRFLGHL